jgi:hypothetical protein
MKLTLPIHLAHAESVKRHLREAKKVALGLLYYAGLEILFFLIAAGSIWLMWALLTNAIHISSQQHSYVYHPYEIKYLVITIGGIRRRVAVRRYFERKKLIIKH